MDSREIQDTGHGQLYLLGHDISHSHSPRFHNAMYAALSLPWRLDLLDTTEAQDLSPLMKMPSFVGASVTMPHKVAITKLVDSMTEAARTVQAVNTIFVRTDPDSGVRKYIGTNTDCIGIRDSIVHNYGTLAEAGRGRPAVVLGGGGASRAAIYALSKLMGASEIFLVNRDAVELRQVVADLAAVGFTAKCTSVIMPEEAQSLPSPGIIVGAVPDVPPSTEAERRVRAVMAAFLDKPVKGVLLDMCYHPSPETQLMVLARRSGWSVVNGTEAFLYQAVAQDSLWTQRPADELPVEAARAALPSSHI
ncbi:hypothetical protein ACO1O0_003754 [Amphichorda felina]